VGLEEPDQVGMHERLAAQDPEEAVAVLLGVPDQPVELLEREQVRGLVDVDPAAPGSAGCSRW
jgi:hypothetical protein